MYNKNPFYTQAKVSKLLINKNILIFKINNHKKTKIYLLNLK